MKQGLAAPAALGLGLAVDPGSRLIDGRMLAHNRLFAIGPLTRSLFWEATAVPDLREHAMAIAVSVVEALKRPDEYRLAFQYGSMEPLTAQHH